MGAQAAGRALPPSGGDVGLGALWAGVGQGVEVQGWGLEALPDSWTCPGGAGTGLQAGQRVSHLGGLLSSAHVFQAVSFKPGRTSVLKNVVYGSPLSGLNHTGVMTLWPVMVTRECHQG